MEHLTKLKSPYAEQAIANYNDDNITKYVPHLLNTVIDVEQALNLAFHWENSSQGEKYWNNVYDNIEKCLK